MNYALREKKEPNEKQTFSFWCKTCKSEKERKRELQEFFFSLFVLSPNPQNIWKERKMNVFITNEFIYDEFFFSRSFVMSVINFVCSFDINTVLYLIECFLHRNIIFEWAFSTPFQTYLFIVHSVHPQSFDFFFGNNNFSLTLHSTFPAQWIKSNFLCICERIKKNCLIIQSHIDIVNSVCVCVLISECIRVVLCETENN